MTALVVGAVRVMRVTVGKWYLTLIMHVGHTSSPAGSSTASAITPSFQLVHRKAMATMLLVLPLQLSDSHHSLI
jgi:hypothetical protein